MNQAQEGNFNWGNIEIAFSAVAMFGRNSEFSRVLYAGYMEPPNRQTSVCQYMISRECIARRAVLCGENSLL